MFVERAAHIRRANDVLGEHDANRPNGEQQKGPLFHARPQGMKQAVLVLFRGLHAHARKRNRGNGHHDDAQQKHDQFERVIHSRDVRLVQSRGERTIHHVV